MKKKQRTKVIVFAVIAIGLLLLIISNKKPQISAIYYDSEGMVIKDEPNIFLMAAGTDAVNEIPTDAASIQFKVTVQNNNNMDVSVDAPILYGPDGVKITGFTGGKITVPANSNKVLTSSIIDISTISTEGLFKFDVNYSYGASTAKSQYNWSYKKSQQGLYTFRYPENMLDGYYAVPLKNCPADKCSSCRGSSSYACGSNGTKNEYIIKSGFVEDFTFNASIPVVSIWDLRTTSIADIPGKCYVGDCTRYDTRNVICVYSQTNISTKTFSCDKWQMVPSSMEGQNVICAGGKTVNIYEGHKLNDGQVCTKPKTVNFYYIWNNASGYDPNWKNKFNLMFDKVNAYLKTYNMELQANYYEYETKDYSVCTLNSMTSSHPAYRPGDLQVLLPNGYCGSCVSTKLHKGCYSVHTILHEFGHAFGCGHVGNKESLGSYLYAGGVMSYGYDLDPDNRYYNSEFIYECTIITWALGQMQ